MAGMLPGVEFARRRRLRAVGSSAEAPCAGTSRRTSLGLYGAGNGQGHAAAGFPKVTENPWIVCRPILFDSCMFYLSNLDLVD
jgi:hypothetical protein